MNKNQVISLISKDRWKDFLSFMKGSTVGLNSDGSIDYYENDVESYMINNNIQPNKEAYWKCNCGSYHKGFPYECKLNNIKRMIKLYRSSENIYASQVLESIERELK